MGFFGLPENVSPPKKGARSPLRGQVSDVAMLHKMGCKACPLNKAEHVQTGKIEPSGADRPLVYILGAAPTRAADSVGKPFAGDASRFYRDCVPPEMRSKVRWGNVIRSFPGQGPIVPTMNRDQVKALVDTKMPAVIEIECCRPSVTRDIEESKPRAIFGLGLIPLKWAAPGIANATAYLWQGRRMPVKIGTHTCWYYPFVTHIDVEKTRKWDTHITDDAKHFERCMTNAFVELSKDDTEPHVVTTEEALSNVTIINGSGGLSDFKRVKSFISDALQDQLNGLDYETNALRPYNDETKILTFAIARATETLAVALDHRGNKWDDDLRERVRAELERYLMTDGPIKAAHQLAFELEWSGVKFGRECVRGSKWGDTISQAYIINPKQGLLGLEDLTHQYWGFNLKAISGVDRKNLDAEPVDDVLLYNGMDSKYHRALYRVQRARLKQQGMADVYAAQLRRVPTLVLTQMKGITLNQEVIARFRERYQSQMRKRVEEMRGLKCWAVFKRNHGAEFNPGSTQDVVKMLTIIGHKSRSTKAEVLSAINHPLIDPLLKWRKAQKLLGTYALPVSVEHEDGGYDGAKVPRSRHVFDDGSIHPITSTYKVETWRTSCLRKGTLVTIPGGTKPIEKIEVGDLVYTYDAHCKLALRKVTRTMMNGHKKLVRVRWVTRGNRSGYLDTTPCHRFRMVDGSYKRADELVAKGTKDRKVRRRGDQTLALARGVRSEYNYLYITDVAGSVRENRFVFESINGWSPGHVHHRDGNKLNDAPGNLQGMSESEHHSHHAVKRFIPKQVLIDALRRGNGVRMALRDLGCDFVTIKRNMAEHSVVWGGRKNNKVRPWQRANNHIIESVTPLRGEHPVYDISVDGSPCFIANEVCVHNSEDPNIQNFPKRGANVDIRRSVEAPPGYKIVAFDYAGIQARNIAMESRDDEFVKTFQGGFDIHAVWTEKIVKRYPKWAPANIGTDKNVFKESRGIAKNQFVFPTFFGAKGASIGVGIAKGGHSEIPASIITELQEELFEQFPDIHKWQRKVQKNYDRHGYVTGLSGFRRYAPIGYNQIINTPIQSDEALIVCTAMSALSEMNPDRYQAIMEIHDDLTFMVPTKKVEAYSEVILAEMTRHRFDWINVPLVVEYSIGDNWCDLKDAGVFKMRDDGSGIESTHK